MRAEGGKGKNGSGPDQVREEIDAPGDIRDIRDNDIQYALVQCLKCM